MDKNEKTILHSLENLKRDISKITPEKLDDELAKQMDIFKNTQIDKEVYEKSLVLIKEIMGLMEQKMEETKKELNKLTTTMNHKKKYDLYK